MCRIDDDWDMLVSSTNPEAVAATDLFCHDCGRVIQLGEAFTLYGMTPADRPMLAVVQYEQAKAWVDTTKPFLVLPDDDTAAVFEALGFIVDEVEDHDAAPTEYVEQCGQCFVAARWLTKVCSQHTVCVTREDLHEHTLEYTRQQLGPDFVAAEAACQNGWRAPNGDRLLVPTLAEMIERAILHAVAEGLVEV